MPRIALINILIGFTVIFIAACFGSFIAYDTTAAFLQGGAQLDNWQLLLQRSSHGHFNLFGFLHISFGLTLAYSELSLRVKKLQTIGLGLGTLAMGPGLTLKSTEAPSLQPAMIEYALGVLLSLALVAVGTHAFGILCKLLKRG